MASSRCAAPRWRSSRAATTGTGRLLPRLKRRSGIAGRMIPPPSTGSMRSGCGSGANSLPEPGLVLQAFDRMADGESRGRESVENLFQRAFVHAAGVQHARDAIAAARHQIVELRLLPQGGHLGRALELLKAFHGADQLL